MSADIFYEVSPVEGGVRIDQITCDIEDLMIPETIDGRPVREIGKHAVFSGSPMVKSIVVPETVRVLHPYAFALCMQLERLVLNEGLEVMDASSIAATSITALILPASLKELGHPEEMDCRILVHPENPVYFSDGYGLYERTDNGSILLAVNPRSARTEYAVLSGCKAIAKSAFLGVERQEGSREWLEKLSLPASLAQIPEGAFSIGRSLRGGYGVREVTIDPKNPVFVMRDGLLCKRLEDDRLELVRCFSEEEVLKLPENILILDTECFNHCPVKRLSCASIPDIHENAFLGCSLEEFQVKDKDIIIRFPLSTDFIRTELLKSFNKNGHLYDFEAYDKLLLTNWLNHGRVRMLLGRLLFPLDLSETTREGFCARIKKESLSMVTMLLKAGDMGGIRELLSLALLDKTMLESCTEEAGRLQSGEGKLLFMNVLRQMTAEPDEFEL